MELPTFLSCLVCMCPAIICTYNSGDGTCAVHSRWGRPQHFWGGGGPHVIVMMVLVLCILHRWGRPDWKPSREFLRQDWTRLPLLWCPLPSWWVCRNTDFGTSNRCFQMLCPRKKRCLGIMGWTCTLPYPSHYRISSKFSRSKTFVIQPSQLLTDNNFRDPLLIWLVGTPIGLEISVDKIFVIHLTFTKITKILAL